MQFAPGQGPGAFEQQLAIQQDQAATQRDLLLIENLSRSLEEDEKHMYELFNYQGNIKYDHAYLNKAILSKIRESTGWSNMLQNYDGRDARLTHPGLGSRNEGLVMRPGAHSGLTHHSQAGYSDIPGLQELQELETQLK